MYIWIWPNALLDNNPCLRVWTSVMASQYVYATFSMSPVVACPVHVAGGKHVHVHVLMQHPGGKHVHVHVLMQHPAAWLAVSSM